LIARSHRAISSTGARIPPDDAAPPIEVHQFAVDVVDDLDLCRRTQKVQRGPARDDLDLTLVPWEPRNEMVREATLAADPGNDGICQ
jgi:hypothetical protein